MAGAGPGHGDREEEDDEAFWVLPRESEDGVGG